MRDTRSDQGRACAFVYRQRPGARATLNGSLEDEHLFRRAFTTKGQGRGLGTYGAKLIAERHLGATLGFDSDPSTGTTFTVTLPHRP